MTPDGSPHRFEVNMMHFRSSRRLLALGSFGTLALFAARAPDAVAQQASQGSQAATITGTVKSESGQPIENANAFIQEMNISVATNAQGRYSMVIPGERVRGQAVVLRVRAISHLAQSRPITLRAGTQTIDFEMK